MSVYTNSSVSASPKLPFMSMSDVYHETHLKSFKTDSTSSTLQHLPLVLTAILNPDLDPWPLNTFRQLKQNKYLSNRCIILC